MGKRGTGREDVLLGLVLLCATNGTSAAPVLTPGELTGIPRELAAVWQQMSGFRLWHIMVLFLWNQ